MARSYISSRCRSRSGPRPRPVAAKSIAVLPFQNRSADKNNEYFVVGMQDLILTKLADIGGLKVIARTLKKYVKYKPAVIPAIPAPTSTPSQPSP